MKNRSIMPPLLTIFEKDPRMIRLLHNARCSKSRAALVLAENAAQRHNRELFVLDYQKHPLSADDLTDLHAKLRVPAKDMLRSEDPAFKALNLDVNSLDDAAIIKVLAEQPALLQRPVVIVGERAVIARPAELAQPLLD